MNKVKRYTVELGPNFNTDSTSVVYINWAEQPEWTTNQVVSVTPGTEVELLDFVLDVPAGASSLVKYTTSTKALGFFLDSNGQLLQNNKAYLVCPRENWVEFNVPETDLSSVPG